MTVGFEKVLIAVLFLTIVAVIVSNKRTVTLVHDLGQFLVSMTGKVQNA